MTISILFEDNDLIAINKPAGIVVNKADSVKVPTVQDWAQDYLHILPAKKQRTAPHSPEMVQETAFYDRAGVVHRLDKETSGILLIGKTRESFIALQQQFATRTISKSYIALVHGMLPAPEGEINVPVGRLPWNRERFGVVVGGKPSSTTYRVVERFTSPSTGEQLSLVDLFPETGRTHQIRVHMKYLGHPIVADDFYAGRKQGLKDKEWCPRLFLHAAKISFIHPTTGVRQTIALELPDDLRHVLEHLAKL